jgi:NADH-quinone oxidoreductase subunit J
MDITSGLFYLFSAILLFSAYRVVTASNPVHAVLFLVLCFTQAATLWMLLGAEFLSIVLVLVYIGAVMVLFLFVVMMLDIRIEQMKRAFWRHFPLAIGLGILIALEIILIVYHGFEVQDLTSIPVKTDIGNTRALGQLLYTDYLYPLEIAALILLVAMVAAIALTLRGRKETKTDIEKQIRIQAQDRLTIVKMKAEPSVHLHQGEKN